MVGILLSTLPVFLYCILLFFLDSFSIIQFRRLLRAGLWGGLVCFVLYFLDNLVPEVKFWDVLIPTLEEILKYVFVVRMIRKGRCAFFSDAAIYGATVGAGFALFENILYAVNIHSMTTLEFVYRGFATSFLHMGMTAIATTLLLLFHAPFRAVVKSKILNILYLIISVIPAILLHLLHNSFMLPPVISMFAVIAVVGLIFIVLLLYNEKQVYQWLESSINNEEHLMSAIKKGQFSQTWEGRYLLKVKEQFKPEVFLDVIDYARIHTELALFAKGHLMLIEAGFTLTDEEKKEYLDKKTELHHLKKNIGKVGMFTLEPIFKTKIAAHLIETYL